MRWLGFDVTSRGRVLAAVLGSAAIILAACGGGGDGAPANSEGPAAPRSGAHPLSVVDDTGTEVRLTAPPTRVIALLPSVTDLLIDLDLAERVVGTDDFSLDDPALAGLPSVGGNNFVFSIEVATTLEPDLIVAASGGTEQFVEQARTLGLPTIVLDFPANVEQMLEQIRFLGEVFGIADAAEALASDLQARLDRVTEAVADRDRVRVYLEVDQSTPTQPFSVGPGSLHHDVLTLAGGENIFADVGSAFPQVNWEVIISGDPDVILLLDSTEFADELAFNPVTVEEVAARSGWDQIRAVREGRIVPLPSDLFNVGTQLVDAVERVAEVLAEARSKTSAAWRSAGERAQWAA